MEYPKARHSNCKINRCEVCLEDADVLKDFLEKETGVNMVDHLGKYHKWLSDNGINPETEYGWWTDEVFEKDNLQGYIDRWVKVTA